MGLDAAQGALVIIGGAEDRHEDRQILREFIGLAGGREAQVVVLTAATSEPEEAGETYIDVFGALGAANVQVVDTRDRADANQFKAIKAIGKATGIFFTGGNQARIVESIKHTLLDDAISKRYLEGVVIAGTSAGAAIMPERMIVRGESETSPRGDTVLLGPGMGFVRGMVLDQHFAQRGRLGRLLAALLLDPAVIGVGIDENTAIVIQGTEFRVLGEGSVTVVDDSSVTHSNLENITDRQPMSVFGVKLHILTEGCRFDLRLRQPIARNEGLLRS
ncbi:MAG: cyanophycinase [Drouetiella hepatica Uher 2000/2452]|uniref:Cyanophycinase n=1 Tax=Drouetiella hepatica Uher 2000/2452 TaxID=904376 RepID=A0A951Q6B9_9CYAN|nr:cyanophycinase [Drouetiella hepatica Uher 2000/2452]